MKTIYHVVTPLGTVTFLDYEGVQGFIEPKTLDELIDSVVVTESQVSDIHYAMFADWQHRGAKGA